MKLFILRHAGADRCVIILILPDFFGTRPTLEDWNLGHGGQSYEPAMRPAAHSLCSISLITSGLIVAERRLRAQRVDREPMYPIQAPH